jgi:two-component system heavy metal sensor histidine kinase CusS
VLSDHDPLLCINGTAQILSATFRCWIIFKLRKRIQRELRVVCDFYEPAATEAGVRLSVSAPEQLAPRLDLTLFQRAVGNLVQNALAHTPNGGQVCIEVQNGGGQLAISVSDTGAGIPKEHLPRVFDRFYRADPARTRNSGGCGLGLPIVQSIARLHGGNVAIVSQVGQGTKVTLTLSSGPAEV